MQPLTLVKFIIKHVTIALPRSHGTVSYESVNVERCLLCFSQHYLKMFFGLRVIIEVGKPAEDQTGLC